VLPELRDLFRELAHGSDVRAIVLTGAGGLVEIQGTAEGAPFSEEQLVELLTLARKGIGELVELQKQALL